MILRDLELRMKLPSLQRFLLTAIVTSLCLAAAAQQTRTNALNDPRLDARVESLVRQMTLEEKIGQLNQYSGGQATGPESGRGDYRQMIAKGQIGSLLNVTGAADTNALQKLAVEQSRMKIPLLFGLDVIHGYRTIFPVPLAMAATWDPTLVERASRVAAEEATAAGVRWTFSPMVDIARDARWGRIVEGAGEDPYLGSVMAAAQVRGYQGDNLASPNAVLATIKHFAAYGGAEAGREYNIVSLSERDLWNVYLPPYHGATVEREQRDVLSAEHRAASREIAREAIVLLTNKSVAGAPALPLRRDLKSLAVIGTLANDSAAPLGPWNGAGRKQDAVTVLAGLRAALPTTTISFAAGVPLDTVRVEGAVSTPGITEAEQLARTSDAVL